MDREEECSAKKREVLIHYKVVETDREEADSWRHPCSVIVFFLFSFFSVFFPYKRDFLCFGPVFIYRISPIRLVFFPVRNQGLSVLMHWLVQYTGQYGTELTSLVPTKDIKPK